MELNSQEMDVSKKLVQLQNDIMKSLKPKNQEKLKEFRNRVSDILANNETDYSLLKWLKARNFDVTAAEEMFRNNYKWREQMQVDVLAKEFKTPEAMKKYYPHGFFGNDKNGCPIWIMCTGNIDIKGLLKSVSKHEFIKHLICQLEEDVHNLNSQSNKLEKLIEKHTVILDLENFDIKIALWKPAFDLLVGYLKMYESNYPESLEIGYLINAPRIFTMFFTMIKPFLSEETRKKVHIYGKNGWKEELIKNIDADQLPKHWGGTAVDEIDGNPKCTSKICIGGPVPKSYYVNNSVDFKEEEMQTKIINPKGRYTIDVNVEKPNSTLFWIFRTDQHDLGFGINFQPSNAENKKAEEIMPLDRVNSQLVPEEGTLTCTETGKYTLIFDNSFSWYRSKKLLYKVYVVAGETTTNIDG